MNISWVFRGRVGYTNNLRWRRVSADSGTSRKITITIKNREVVLGITKFDLQSVSQWPTSVECETSVQMLPRISVF